MSIARHHNEWLSLVPHSGPFLSLPVLCSAFPQGLDAHDSDHARNLRMAFGEWEKSHDGKRIDPNLHNEWVRFVLKQTLGYEGLLAEGQEIPQTIKSDLQGYRETVRPDLVLNDPETKKARILIQVYPKIQSLTKPIAGSSCPTWADGRMMQLLKDTGIRLGIVTNGEHWLLVNVKKDQTTGYASWYSTLWQEEPITLRAFRTILGSDRLFSVPADQTLEALLDASASDQQEVTDQLGYQVRKAVEVVIQALDKADQEHHGDLLRDISEKTLYESALTVMMRLVFLFCAEERELLPHGDDLYDKNYAVSTLREQLRVTADQFGEEILGLRHDAWCRLLTTFRAVYAGLKHDRLRLPAYGGSLFNPDRFPFLEGRKSGTTWRTTEATPLPINNRTVLHILEALQVLQTKVGKTIEARSLSFRALDIEQIGHVYEGLLDHTAKRATEPVLGLSGTRDKEPEITLAELEKLREKGEKDTIKFLKEETGRSDSALKKGLETKVEDHLVARFRTACQDTSLWERVKPFAGLVRLDNLEYPVVINTGSVFVTSGTDRRSSGTHYTPRSLTEPVVQYTLEPLVYIGPAEGLPIEQWKLRSAKELLDLRICDMACGSGAFLVQVCRYLAARLLEAWEIAKRDNPGAVHITPEGQPSTGSPDELLIPDDPDERHIYALRIVAQRCIYGVDINPLAVEMAKLSLWLLTLSKDKPFEFLDHAIRCGDSLVGIQNLEQLRRFSLDGKGEENNLLLQFLAPKIKEAIALRRQISELQSTTVEDIEAQDRMLREASEKIERLKLAADLLIAAEFVSGSASDKRSARDNAAIKVALHFNDGDLTTFRQEAQNALNGQKTFHWPLEFPEVIVERGGFDGVVGNPPFLGGTRISMRLGDSYLHALYSIFPKFGNRADLVCLFFLRAASLLHHRSVFGLIAINTIAEGDTRAVGLDVLISEGANVYRAVRSLPWPGSANHNVACVHCCLGIWNGLRILDYKPVEFISSFLDDSKTETPPKALAANLPLSFEGAKPGATGFVISPEHARQLIASNPKNKEVLFPYLRGDDVNSLADQSPTAWVIDFGGRSLSQSQEYPDCFSHVLQNVKPERDLVKRKSHREKWWTHAELRPGMYDALKTLESVTIHAFTSKYVAFSVVKNDCRFAAPMNVFAFSDWWQFAVLQSAVHSVWVLKYASSMVERVRYTRTDVFDTYPMPTVSAAASLDKIGSRYHEHRQKVMLIRQEGLTKTYNRFHNPDEASEDIQKLRDLHVEMDNAVAAAYGWSDLNLDHGFHETKQGIRFTISEPARREVLQRLLKLNHERYAEEVKQGLHEKKKGATKSASPKKLARLKEDKPDKPATPMLDFGDDDQ